MPVTAERPKSRVARFTLLTCSALACVYLLLCAALYGAMSQPPQVFGQIMARVPGPLMIALPFAPLWKRARAGPVQVGDRAPDFTLPMLDGSARVTLSQHRGVRPVVLVFGSYT